MQKISTNYHHQNQVTTTPLVQELVFDAQRGQWVVPHQPPQMAPLPPQTKLAPRVANAGKNIVVGGGMLVGYGVLIVLEAGGHLLMGLGEFFQILWLSSRKYPTNAHERAEMPRKVEKIKVEVNVKIEA